MAQQWMNYIDGDWVKGGAGFLEVVDPATGLAIGEHALASVEDVDRAVAAARRVHLSGVLSDVRPVERSRMVQGMGRFFLSHRDEIAHELTLEQGKPLWEALGEVTNAARYFEYYGNQGETVEGKSIPLGSAYYDFTSYEPYGVSAQIIPWNFPLEIASRSIAAGLVTANTVVLKTSELTPVASRWFALAAEEAGVPKGALNILCGLGHEAGAALAGHADVNQIVFTGSVPTGIAIATAGAQNVVPCVLELGGKSAAIVHEDADLAAFETDIRRGIYTNAGQVCSAMSRILVHESRYNELLERAAKVATSLSVGPGIERVEAGPTMGAMVSLKQRDRAVGMVADAVQEGASVVAGGHALNINGAFMAPTVVADVTPDMTIAQQEVFGPVTSVMRFKDEDEAIAIANGTQYGLVGGVFTQNVDRALRTARQIKSGQVFVNEWFAGGVETPFGGYGKSGYGREKGREALWNYVQTKNIAIKLGQ